MNDQKSDFRKEVTMPQENTQPLRETKGRIVHVRITYYYVQVDWDIGDNLMTRDVFPNHDHPHGTMKAKTDQYLALLGRDEDVLTETDTSLLTGTEAFLRLSPQNEVIDVLPIA
jgi:hypothetical protein